MKNKTLLIALVAIIMTLTALICLGSVSANEEMVVYVSANGTGDGSSPERPLGPSLVNATVTYGSETYTFTDATYDDAIAKLLEIKASGKTKISGTNAVWQASALYRAFIAIGANDGTIVIMDTVPFNAAERLENGSAADAQIPTSVSGNITITSNYGGVDYRNNGAVLLYDQTGWTSINLWIKGAKTTWKDINIEHHLNTSVSPGAWEQAAIYCGGNKTVFDTGVSVKSVDHSSGTPTPINSWVSVFAGARYSVVSSGDLTIKSGSWHGVYGAGHALSGNNTAAVSGNSVINVEGGDILMLCGAASTIPYRNIGYVGGDLDINITGGEVSNIYALTSAGVKGALTIDVAYPAKVLAANLTADEKTPANVPTSVKFTYDANTVLSVNGFNESDIIVNGGTVTPPPVEPEEPDNPVVTDTSVMYIANVSRGTGDGSSPENAMGHAVDYDNTAAGAHRKHAFYLALTANDNALLTNGGTIVIVDELSIDYADGRRASFSEFQWPSIPGGKNITITSLYNGVDYRKQGAKLVLDTTNYGINWRIKAPTTWEYLDIEAKYNSSRNYGKSVDGVAMISFYGNKTVINREVNVTSNDTAGMTEYYPTLTAYDRIGNKVAVSSNTDLTINCGTWDKVYGSCYGMYSANAQYGALQGIVNITVNGGKIGEIYGTNYPNPNFTFSLEGDVNINLNGGEVNTVYASSHTGVTGKINVTVDKSVKGLERVWGYYYTGKFAAPTDATITYDRSNLSDDKVKYFTAINATEAVKPDVIYVSTNGTGDGLSPDSPLGNDADYDYSITHEMDYTNKASGKLALYKAFNLLRETGGTIVLVDDLILDTAEARIPTQEGRKFAPAELTMPKVEGKILITNEYNGVKYPSKLVLDLDKCNTTFLLFRSAVTFENIDIEHKYDPDDLNGWGTPYAIAANGNELVIGKNVNVTSLNADTGKEGALYPMLLGGHRYNRIKTGVSLTVESGKWSTVIAGSYGMIANYPGLVEGDAVLNIKGGQIETVLGTSSLDRAFGSIQGKLEINITGGRVEKLYATASNGAENEIVVNIAETAEYVGMAWGSVSGDSVPTNATINYPRSVISDSNVKYWTRNEGSGEQKGDVNGDGMVNADDAILLVYHALFPNEYYVKADCDFDGSGIVNIEDAIYLLYHLFFAEDFPLA